MSATADTATRAPIAGAGALVATNLVTLATALAFDWPLSSLLWPYLAQSVLIGWYSRRRMLELRTFSTEGLKVDGRPVAPTPETQRSSANFFTLHYGFFHLVYVAALVSTAGAPTGADAAAMLALAASFGFTHAASFRANLPAEAERPVNLGALMFLPYLRVLPMHLTMLMGGTLFGGAEGFAMVVFVALKTAADVAMHYAEHRILRR